MRGNWKNHILAALAVVFCIGNAGLVTAQTQTAPAVAATATKAPPTAHDFSVIVNRGFTISPNGRMLAFISGEGETASVAIFDIARGENQIVRLGATVKPRRIEWAGDGHLLVHASYFYNIEKRVRYKEYSWEIMRTASYSIASKTFKLLMPNDDLEYNTALPIQYVNQTNPTDIILSAISSNDVLLNGPGNDEGMFSLFRASLATGRGPVIATGTIYTEDFALDQSGRPRLRVDIKAVERVVTLFKAEGSNWVKFLEFEDEIELPFSLEGFLDENNVLVVVNDEGIRKPKKLNMVSGEMSPIYENETRSVSHIRLDPYTKTPIAIVYESFRQQVKWLDPQMEQFQTLLNGAFAGEDVFIDHWDRGRNLLIVGTQSGNSQHHTYMFDAATNQANELSRFPDSFDDYEFATKTLETMVASDGLEIPVLVTRSPNESRKRPAVVMPHGGPEAHDDFSYDYISQFLASRGYVVIQPQFRGSTGFGENFAEKGRGEWAGKMQSDVNETVKWASDRGWIDPNRTCIVGASYGGYAAMVGATQTPDLYKCAISFGGVFDLAALQARVSGRNGENSVGLAYWREHIGISNFESEKIRAISPLFQAQNATIPILIMHGKDDTVVPITQSIRMANALRSAGKNVQLIELDGEDHWLSREAGREKFLTEMERFLAPILRPDIQ